MNNENSQNQPIAPAWLSRKIENWIDKKSKKISQCFLINRKNIYILPTKSGWLFILTLIAILSGAINYNNSMAYLLCFFLTSLGFIAMLQTHQNLNNININAMHSLPTYCGKPIEFIFNISSTSQQRHYAINTETSSEALSISANLQPKFIVTQKTIKRGQQNPTRFKISTEFPLGLFYAWAQIKINNPAIIYPKPIINNLQINEFLAGENLDKQQMGDDNYAGIRDYRKGDNPKRLAWKAIAKTGKMYTKEFSKESGDYLMFDFDKFEHTSNTEERLSLLCGLIISASDKKLNYGLKLPTKTINPDHGDFHKHNCLTLLALYKP